MATFIGKLFGMGEPEWMDQDFREEEPEPYFRETISYRNYPQPPSFTCYPDLPPPPSIGHFYEPPMFANYPDAMAYRMFREPPPPLMMPPPSRHPSSASGPPPKVVRFRDPVVQKQQPSRPQEITRRSSQPKKVHPEIELRVPMCCSKCEDKVRNELRKMDGVTMVVCDIAHQKVTVTGKVDPEALLKRARKAKKKAEFYAGTIYSKNFIDFIQSKTAPKQPEVLDVFSLFRHQSSPEMETDTEDLPYDTESSVTFTHPSPSEREDTYASHLDSQQSSSYNQSPSSYHERDSYDHYDVREGGAAYGQYAPAYAYGVMDSHPQSVVPSRPSYEDRDYNPEYESQSTSYSRYEPSYERYDAAGPYQDRQRSGYGYSGESEDYPHHAHSSNHRFSDSGITNPNYMKRIITDY